MKHLKDYYHNRKILKELKSDGIAFRPTPEDARQWFDILNEQIFSNKLKPVDKITISSHRGDDVYAYYYYYTKDDPKHGQTSISLLKKFKDKKFFVEILVHEMIHHFQHLHDEPAGHGPTFLAWKENLKLRGLTLYKVA